MLFEPSAVPEVTEHAAFAPTTVDRFAPVALRPTATVPFVLVAVAPKPIATPNVPVVAFLPRTVASSSPAVIEAPMPMIVHPVELAPMLAPIATPSVAPAPIVTLEPIAMPLPALPTLAELPIAMLLFVNLVLGVISRVASQMNVFAIGFPVTLGVGLLGILLTLPMMQVPFTMALERMLSLFQ